MILLNEGANSMEPKKRAIMDALWTWIRQRPGLEFGNYGEVTSYRSEVRRVGRQLQHARQLLRAVELRDSITADHLLAAFRAYSGRLTCKVSPAQNGRWTVSLDYCTGQYWPTEYRAAACAVAGLALWDDSVVGRRVGARTSGIPMNAKRTKEMFDATDRTRWNEEERALNIKPQYTPGPWSVGEDGGDVFDANGNVMARTSERYREGDARPSPSPEEKANAALIVQAVNAHADLAEALRRIATHEDHVDSQHPGMAGDLRRIARAALKKARIA